LIKKPTDQLRAKHERVTELAMYLIKLNAVDRMAHIDNSTDGGHQKIIIAKIRNLANVRHIKKCSIFEKKTL
jgi:hypothetical protein